MEPKWAKLLNHVRILCFIKKIHYYGKRKPCKNDIAYLVTICISIILCKQGVYLKTLLEAGMCGPLLSPYWLLNDCWIASETSLALFTQKAIH